MILRERLWIGHVQRRAAAGRCLGEERIGVDQRTTGDIDHQGTIGQPGQPGGIDHLFGLRRVRGDQNHHVGLGQQPVEIILSQHQDGVGSGPRATRVIEATSKPASRRSIAGPMFP